MIGIMIGFNRTFMELKLQINDVFSTADTF